MSGTTTSATSAMRRNAAEDDQSDDGNEGGTGCEHRNAECVRNGRRDGVGLQRSEAEPKATNSRIENNTPNHRWPSPRSM